METFRWISPRQLPANFDLRSRGWCLAATSAAADGVRLIDAPSVDPCDQLTLSGCHRALALGVDDSAERAMWLARGFGDVLPADAGLDEIAVRAGRLLAPIWSAIRRHGRLELDPVARDAVVDGLRLRLHPREFALLWRLSDDPDATVPRAELLYDVLGLTIEPGTNALAVHICRLRKKLHVARLSHLLVTGPGDGSYALRVDAAAAAGVGCGNDLDDLDIAGEDGLGDDLAALEEAAA